ncbi:MAG: CDP-alcohol phosphatidyltransferase family protein [Planctomycetaceae bacterium]
MNEPEAIESSAETTASLSTAENPWHDRYLTIPNVICIARIMGSFVLIGLAVTGRTTAFVIGYVFLHFSDWVDGKLARWLNQRSVFGARLDSASDIILFGCLLVGSLILKRSLLREEFVWLIIPVAAFAVATGYGVWKFGRIPSYHTRAAKISNWLVLAGALALLLDWSVWPLRIACVAGTLTNMESIAITLVLPEWKADVSTLWQVWNGRVRSEPSEN